jgi:long-chain acyl-CoA synthetase
VNIDFLLNNLKKNSNNPAVITNDTTYTFEDIYNEYQNCQELLQNNQVKFGSIIALLADFKPKSIALILALIERDCIIVPISATIKNIERYIEISESEYFCDLSGNEIIIKKTGTIVKHQLLLKLKENKNPGLILFSSGTTGEPKAALHNLNMLLEKFKKPGKIFRTVTFLLFDHIGGFNTMMHALANGGTIVTIKSRDVDEVCRTIEKYQVELLPTTPTFLNLFLLSGIYQKYNLSCLKIISYGTEPMTESTLVAMHNIFPNITLKQTYGLSELGIMSTKSEKSDSLWLKLGGEGYEIKIVADVLYIRAKSAMMGYLNAPSPFDKDGWFNTRDKVEVKGEYIKILGRETDLINIGGEKVYPIEIEDVLLKCKGVEDARVFAEKNALVGHIIVAEVCVAHENNNREFIKTLRIYCKKNLEPFKIPTKFSLVESPLYNERLKKKR